MAVVDHLVYAVPDLAAGVDLFEAQLGVRPTYGGAHPGRGTHNALVSFGDSYLELIAPDPDQPDPAEARLFGVDDVSEGRLVTFAARPDPSTDETIESLVERGRDAGHDPGAVVEMSRTSPDGIELHWRLTVPMMTHDGFVPFLIDWGDTPHPSTTAPGGVRVSDLMGTTSHHESANRVLDALGLDQMAVDGDGGLGAILLASPDRFLYL